MTKNIGAFWMWHWHADFLDVALDTLWEELDFLVPLLKLLPILQVEDDSYVCTTWNIYVFPYNIIFLILGP